MIRANELRIGNYYHLVEEGVDINEVYQISDGYSLHLIDEYNNAKPIPLTEEWLLKMCFECGQLKTSKRFWIPNFNIRIFNKSGKTQVSHSGKVYEHIKYVHQLQNLYFALTGEELKIK